MSLGGDNPLSQRADWAAPLEFLPSNELVKTREPTVRTSDTDRHRADRCHRIDELEVAVDVLSAARLEFALTAALHYSFVATTLGLAPLIAALSFAGLKHGPKGEVRRRAANQLARLYLFNYAIGIVTGLVMELQMGLNWTGAGSAYDPIGSFLAMETLTAFFVESTLLGLWLASAGVWSERVRAWLITGVAATAWLSAVWIVAANAYLHRPVGTGADGTFTDPWALLTNPSATTALPHIAGAAAITGGFWTAATGAALILRNGLQAAPIGAEGVLRAREAAVGRCLLALAVPLVAVAAPLTLMFGVAQFGVARAPGSPVAPAGWYGTMLALMMFGGFFILLLTWLVTLPLLLFRRLHRARWMLRLMVALAWVPLALNVAGWVYREESRQPWFIVNQVLVRDALSAPNSTAVMVIGALFVVIGLAAALLTWRLMYASMARPTTPRLDIAPVHRTDESDDQEEMVLS